MVTVIGMTADLIFFFFFFFCFVIASRSIPSERAREAFVQFIWKQLLAQPSQSLKRMLVAKSSALKES